MSFAVLAFKYRVFLTVEWKKPAVNCKVIFYRQESVNVLIWSKKVQSWD